MELSTEARNKAVSGLNDLHMLWQVLFSQEMNKFDDTGTAKYPTVEWGDGEIQASTIFKY